MRTSALFASVIAPAMGMLAAYHGGPEMIANPLRVGLVAAGLFLLAGTSAWAQRPAHYYPLRQPISPYLFYSAINTTGLPNYYTYVQPRLQFQTFLERTRLLTGRFDDRNRLGEIRLSPTPPTRVLEVRETTGYGAPALPGTFMEYSHYYSITPGRR
jgi:hypothetical protein